MQWLGGDSAGLSCNTETNRWKKGLAGKQKAVPTPYAGKFERKVLVEWTYHSNAIEGNTLTLSETKVVLEGITIGGKTFREHLEVINLREAIGYIEEIIKQQEVLSEWQIKNIHSIVLKGILPESAGVYRRENAFISGAEYGGSDFRWYSKVLSSTY